MKPQGAKVNGRSCSIEEKIQASVDDFLSEAKTIHNDLKRLKKLSHGHR